MTPSLYDLLNVDESASTEEIRAAWKAAIADLDPTDRRFRAFNQAAETLLDPERRSAYDAELAAAQPAEVEPEVTPEPEPEVVEPETEAEPDDEPDDEPEAAAVAKSAPRSVSGRVLAAAAALALAAIAGTVWIWTQPGASGDVDRYQGREEAAQQAAAVAEEAIGSVLSYDFRHLDDDVARAAPYFTDDYAAEYRSLIEELGPQAKSAKLVVKGSTIATGIIRSGDDRAEILVFVNQESTRAGTEQEPLKMWVTLTMVSEGDGWLIDQMKVDTATPS